MVDQTVPPRKVLEMSRPGPGSVWKSSLRLNSLRIDFDLRGPHLARISRRVSAFATKARLLTLMIVVVVLAVGQVRAQDFYINRRVQLPDTTINKPIPRLALPTAIYDARGTGMGNTRVADEKSPSSYRYNPAFLGMTDRFVVSGAILANAPVQTVDAIVFIGGKQSELEGAFSLRALQDAVDAYRDGVGFSQQVEEKLAAVSVFATELFEKVIGDPENPDVHGALFDVGARVQVGHWGFSLYGYGQSGMAAYPGPVLGPLINIYLRTDFQDSAQAAAAIAEIEALKDVIIDPVTGQVSPGALPGFFSLTYTDVVASAGYGFMLADSLSVGANLKVINRRFSAARISANDASDVTQSLFADLSNVETGVTFDVGALYRTTAGLTIGMSVQNLIPVAVLNSGYSINYGSVRVARDVDAQGNPIVNVDGDTALVAFTQKTIIEGPAKLALPLVANIGASLAISDDWDAAFEVVDVAQQVTVYKNYAERICFGTEYRFHLFGDILQLAPRIGFANAEATFGLGVRMFDHFRLDAAYYTAAIVQARQNIAVQLSVDW